MAGFSCRIESQRRDFKGTQCDRDLASRAGRFTASQSLPLACDMIGRSATLSSPHAHMMAPSQDITPRLAPRHTVVPSYIIPSTHLLMRGSPHTSHMSLTKCSDANCKCQQRGHHTLRPVDQSLRRSSSHDHRRLESRACQTTDNGRKDKLRCSPDHDQSESQLCRLSRIVLEL